MQGYLSRDGMPPADLVAAGRAEVKGYGGVVINGSVASVDAVDESAFDITLVDGAHLRARRVIVATGLRDELPDVPGLRERWARDVLHCPYCHGYEVRDQPVGVLGGTVEAVAHALLIRQWSADVVFFANAVDPTADQMAMLAARGVTTVPGRVTRIVVEDDHLVGLEIDDGRVVERSVIFVRPRFAPNDQLLRNLGCATDAAGWVTADSTGRTSVPGVWVAGNVANPRAQVITAAGEGSAAAIAVNADLVDEDVRTALQRLTHRSA
jgi:thioredoxin reductase